MDFIHSESRLKFPEYRAPGSDKWQQISWEEAFDRIAKLMKEDRDANYIAQTPKARLLTAGSPPECCVLPRRATKPAI